MLYVSNIYHDNSVDITDTDDGVTERVNRQDLLSYINMDININGVSFDSSGITVGVYHVRNIQGEIAKLNMLKGVNMKVSNGVLICLNLRNLRSDVTIRLSDYCHKIKDKSVVCRGSCNNYKATLILDDKVSFKMTAFYHMRFSIFDVVIFDLRELKSNALAERIYKLIPVEKDDISIYKNSIIDSRERLLKNLALATIINIDNFGESLMFSSMFKFVSIMGEEDFKYMHNFLSKKFLNSFKQLTKVKIEVNSAFRQDLIDRSYRPRKIIVNVVKYKEFDTNCFDSLLSFLLRYSNVVSSDVKCFCGYIKFFAVHHLDNEIISIWRDFWDSIHRQARKLFMDEYSEYI